MEEQQPAKFRKSQIIRNIYFYLASFITLVIVVGSLIALINLGLKTWVLTDANNDPYSTGPPPSLYFDQESSIPEKSASKIDCDEECQLGEDEKAVITGWEESYAAWQESNNNPNILNSQSAVAAFSFLIIALPIFLIHFRIVQKDAKKAGGHTVIRPIYFYLVSLGALLMFVIAGGIMINLVLKTWVFPSASEADRLNQKISSPDIYMIMETNAVQSIVDCAEKCQLETATVTAAENWLTDYQNWEEVSQGPYNNTQGEAAGNLPFIMLGIPLFWYHWRTVRKEQEVKNN
ncbi:hypothetical protein KKA01_02525 [Patescibacteria group bacterium]|nr:hypothetical protein [Patescibacteria group bacterium]